MAEGYLGVDIVARWRQARLVALGDRKAPVAYAPCLIQTAGDPTLPVALAPFEAEQDDSLPSSLTVRGRDRLSPPFAEIGPEWVAELGHVLPPSLEEADVGESGSSGLLLPITWQRMKHDSDLLDAELIPQMIVLLDALQLANKPGALPEAIHQIRLHFPGSLLWAPGIGGPDNLAILAWMGVDIFDLARSRQAMYAGALLTPEGPRMPEETLGEEVDGISMMAAWTQELASVRRAIRDGTLRELVEKRAPNSPRTVEHLRYHDRIISRCKSGILASHVPEGTRFPCHTFASREDPVVTDWVNFISDSYRSPICQREVLILLPCSARKPYRTSRSHRKYMGAIPNTGAHQVMVTSPLGLVPRDLERVWPACHYDVPVTGDWDGDEITRIRTLVAGFVSAQGYKVVVNHSGMELGELGIPVIDSRIEGSPTSDQNLANLRDIVSQVCKQHSVGKVGGNRLLIEEFRSVSRLHLGTDEWMEGMSISGRPPRFKVMKDGEQMAMWNPERSGLSLSKSALPLLHESKSLPVVEIECQGGWSGDIFASMVKSFPKHVRTGSDMLVVRDGVLIGSARAHAPGYAWEYSPGRLAKAHHRLPAAK